MVSWLQSRWAILSYLLLSKTSRLQPSFCSTSSYVSSSPRASPVLIWPWVEARCFDGLLDYTLQKHPHTTPSHLYHTDSYLFSSVVRTSRTTRCARILYWKMKADAVSCVHVCGLSRIAHALGAVPLGSDNGKPACARSTGAATQREMYGR